MVDVVAKVHEVEQAVGGDFVPDGVALLLLARALSGVQADRFVHLLVGLGESCKVVGVVVHVLDEEATQLNHCWLIETRKLDMLLLIEKCEDELEHGSFEFRNQ